MKKLVLSIVAVLISITTFAQSLAGTEWNGWDSGNSKKVVGTPGSSNVGDVIKPVISVEHSSSENVLLSKALESSLVIIKQQYRLEKDGTWWGNDGLDYFGQTFSLGIKVSGGMLFTSTVMYPWEYDSNFANIDKDYTPYVYNSYMTAISSNSFERTNLELESKFVSPISVMGQSENKNALAVFRHENSKASFGLPLIDHAALEESVRGYQVWVYYDGSNASLKVDDYVYEPNGSSAERQTVNSDDRIIGGLAVSVNFQPGGRMQLMLLGVAVQDPKSKNWSMMSVNK